MSYVDAVVELFRCTGFVGAVALAIAAAFRAVGAAAKPAVGGITSVEEERRRARVLGWFAQGTIFALLALLFAIDALIRAVQQLDLK